MQARGLPQWPAHAAVGRRAAGGVSVEWVAVAALVVAILAAVAASGAGQRVADTVASLVCQAAGVAEGDCAAPQPPTGPTPGSSPTPPGEGSQGVDAAVVAEVAAEVGDLLDGHWLWGVTADDLDELTGVLAALSDAELDAVVAELSPEQLETLVDEAFGEATVARWRNLSETQRAALANDVLARLSPQQLARLDPEQLVDDVLPRLSPANREQMLTAIDFEGVGRVAVEDARSGAAWAGGEPATGNGELDAVHDAAADFWEYLYVEFGRDSLDGDGGPMVGVVNSDEPANAHWSRTDGQTRYREGWAVESVVVHEFAHGLVDEVTGGLDTEDVETTAVNEALADMFSMNVTGEGTVGNDLPEDVRSEPLRIPEDPQAHSQNHPDHARDFDETQGGHHNSTILSHAYHELAEDIGQDAAEQVLYGSLDRLEADAGFEDLRSAMLDAAGEEYGADSGERDGVEQAFAEVGLDGSWDPQDPDPDDDDPDDSGPGPRG